MRSKERLLHEHNKRFSLNTLLHPRRFRLISVRVAPLNHESLRCHRSRCWLEQAIQRDGELAHLESQNHSLEADRTLRERMICVMFKSPTAVQSRWIRQTKSSLL